MMDANTYYTDRSYKVSKLILFLLTFSALTIMINIQPEISRYLFGLPIIVSGLLGIFGAYILYKGRNEPTNEKKLVALVVHSAMVILILTILISNTLYKL
ncbi:MAG: hypothetical protein ABF293_11400 [Flavobacteriaceae bacterium]